MTDFGKMVEDDFSNLFLEWNNEWRPAHRAGSATLSSFLAHKFPSSMGSERKALAGKIQALMRNPKVSHLTVAPMLTQPRQRVGVGVTKSVVLMHLKDPSLRLVLRPGSRKPLGKKFYLSNNGEHKFKGTIEAITTDRDGRGVLGFRTEGGTFSTIKFSSLTTAHVWDHSESPSQIQESVTSSVLKILRESNRPMHIKEITKILVTKYPGVTQSRTPNTSVSSVLAVNKSMFTRVGRGTYMLAGASITPPQLSGSPIVEKLPVASSSPVQFHVPALDSSTQVEVLREILSELRTLNERVAALESVKEGVASLNASFDEVWKNG